MNDSKQKKKKLKVLIFGLDNSGKTSILMSLKRGVNLMDWVSLKPTKGVNIQEVETDDNILNIWDFGGQETFRLDYLKNFGKYSEMADKIIYVIDVKDYERYNQALEFLKLILIKILKEKAKTVLSIYLHKYDPNSEEKEKIDEKIKDILLPGIRGIMPSEIEYDIQKTTIFTVFQKTFLSS